MEAIDFTLQLSYQKTIVVNTFIQYLFSFITLECPYGTRSMFQRYARPPFLKVKLSEGIKKQTKRLHTVLFKQTILPLH